MAKVIKKMSSMSSTKQDKEFEVELIYNPTKSWSKPDKKAGKKIKGKSVIYNMGYCTIWKLSNGKYAVTRGGQTIKSIMSNGEFAKMYDTLGGAKKKYIVEITWEIVNYN